MTRNKANIILVSGKIENGKTTLCLKLLESLSVANLKMKGVICPPVFEDGIKTGIDLLNVATHELRHLATLRNTATEGIFTEKWRFNKDVLEWGDAILQTAVPCDLLFIDELGPLELERREGWQSGLRAVNSRCYSTAIVVVRPSLLKIAAQRWPDARVLDITHENQDEILNQLLAELKP